MSDPANTCQVCQQTFSSRNHLRRHKTSHNQESSVNCPFCGREYSRNDALRRHYQSCSQLRGQEKPLRKRPGRHRRACDACASIRSFCDGHRPCAACRQRDRPCSYRRIGTNPGEIRPKIIDSASMLMSNRDRHQHVIPDRWGTDKASLPFLLNYTATSDRHPGDVNQVLTELATTEINEGGKDPSLPSLHLDAEKVELFAEHSWNLFFGTFQDTGTHQNLPLPEGLDDQDQRCKASQKILSCLLETQSVNPTIGENLDLNRAQEFFQEENILNSVVAYFEQTVRPRSRIVLKSTFKLDSISSPLLLSMILMGASCGISEDMKSKAVEYAEMAEFAVFESQCFHDLLHGDRQVEGNLLSRQSVEILQAAILVILLQISSPKTTVRQRIRIQRYPAVVSAARVTGLTKVRNRWHSHDVLLSHQQFLRNEICIRMMASICMIDSHFIMFFNNPPLFSATEFLFDLPAEDKGIDISDLDTWHEWVQNEKKFQRPPPLSEFLQLLLSDSWVGVTDPRFEHLSIFALFIVISAFHTVIFGVRSSLLKTLDNRDQIVRALSRWQSLWQHLQPQLTEDQIYRAGFMTHAPDLCEFAKILILTPMSDTGGIARESMIPVHELLRHPSNRTI